MECGHCAQVSDLFRLFVNVGKQFQDIKVHCEVMYFIM